MKADPVAFRTKYRKMAADPHAFYRGSACLYYADVTAAEGPVGRRAERRHLDPRRPARRELRHLPELRRPAGLRRQRLRRGLHRPLHLGPPALRGEPRAARLAEGAARGRHRGPDPALRARLPPRRSTTTPASEDDEDFALHLDNTEGPVLEALVQRPQDPAGRPARRDDVRRRGRPDVRPRRLGAHAAQARAGEGREGVRLLPRDDPALQAVRPGRSSTTCATSSASPASASAAPGSRRTTSWWRATARRSTTTSCSR